VLDRPAKLHSYASQSGTSTASVPADDGVDKTGWFGRRFEPQSGVRSMPGTQTRLIRRRLVSVAPSNHGHSIENTTKNRRTGPSLSGSIFVWTIASTLVAADWTACPALPLEAIVFCKLKTTNSSAIQHHTPFLVLPTARMQRRSRSPCFQLVHRLSCIRSNRQQFRRLSRRWAESMPSSLGELAVEQRLVE
jgi:hypothetical protein